MTSLRGRGHPTKLLGGPHHRRHAVVIDPEILRQLEHRSLAVGPREQVVEEAGGLGDVHPGERHESLRCGRRRLGQQGRGENGVQPVHHLLELGAPLLPGIGERIGHLLAHVSGVRSEDDDPAREENSFFDAVRHNDQGVHAGRRIAPQVHDLAAQVLRGQRIEGTERLVHEHDLGRHGESAREAHSLLHAAGQLLRVRLLEPVEAHEVDGPGHRVAPRRAVHAPGLEAHRHVFRHRKPGKERE